VIGPPSTHGPDGGRAGRAAGGRFAGGNRFGRGNPLAGRAAKIRATLLKKLTPAKAAQIADKLIDKAINGDLAAAREIFYFTIGKPTNIDLLERIEALELAMLNRGQDGGSN
jgi:hypothetical protein